MWKMLIFKKGPKINPGLGYVDLSCLWHLYSAASIAKCKVAAFFEPFTCLWLEGFYLSLLRLWSGTDHSFCGTKVYTLFKTQAIERKEIFLQKFLGAFLKEWNDNYFKHDLLKGQMTFNKMAHKLHKTQLFVPFHMVWPILWFLCSLKNSFR